MDTFMIFGLQFSLVAKWYNPTFYVPLLLVSHVMIFAWLLIQVQYGNRLGLGANYKLGGLRS